MTDGLTGLFDRLSARAEALRPEGDPGLAFDTLRETLHLTPTFLAERREAHRELVETDTLCWHVAGVYDAASDAWRATWRAFFLAEYKPEMLRAIQDLRGAQVREQVSLTIPAFRALRSRLEGVAAQIGDFS